MVLPRFGLPPELFGTLFPFHLAFDRNLEVVQVGAVLERICLGLSAGSMLGQHFQIKRPNLQLGFDAIREHSRSLFILEFRHSGLQLKGQMVYVEQPQIMLFLCCPWIIDLTTLGDLGLALDDFPIHDPTADLLFLLQTQNTSLAEARALADKLTSQRAELRKANRTLSDLAERLEQALADQAAIAADNAKLYEQVRRHAEELEAKVETRTLELRQANRRLEEFSRHKSEFLAHMSHELRTPLNAIIGFSQVLVERMFGELNPKQAEYLMDIHSSGDHLLSLINDILDLSKIEAGRMQVELSRFDLPQAIDNALTLVRGRADGHAIALDVAVDARLGEFQGDERKFKQILLNLLSNAVKFTPDGGSVGVRANLANGCVEVAVSDTGIGIPEHEQALIFEEFHQAGSDHAGRHEGTGLGLALTKKFVELHGGTIWVSSEVGAGSTFTFALPVRP